jgi:hypothetical protein
MITVKTIPNTLWDAAKSVNSKVSDRTRLRTTLSASFQMAERMMSYSRAVRTRTTACSNLR